MTTAMTTTTEPLRTGWADTTQSGDTLALAALRAMADRAADLARAAGGRVRRDKDLMLADAGSACLFHNVACSARLLDVAVARAICGFFPPSRPFLVVSPHPTPDLRSAGLDLMGHLPLMVRPAGGTPPTGPPGVTIDEVCDPADLVTWGQVLAAGYPAPPAPIPPGLLGGATRFWLGRAAGRPVATAMSYTAHGVVNVEAIATLPEYRGRGIGAAVSWAATLADPALPAVLIASDDGAGGYRRMGYLAVTRWTLWSTHPAGCRPPMFRNPRSAT